MFDVCCDPVDDDDGGGGDDMGNGERGRVESTPLVVMTISVDDRREDDGVPIEGRGDAIVDILQRSITPGYYPPPIHRTIYERTSGSGNVHQAGEQPMFLFEDIHDITWGARTSHSPSLPVLIELMDVSMGEFTCTYL